MFLFDRNQDKLKNMPTFYNATVGKSKPINHQVLYVTQNKTNDSHKLAVLYKEQSTVSLLIKTS
jgi:hypothetical protein